MTVKLAKIELRRGNTKRLRSKIDKLNGEPVDLRNFVVKWVLYRHNSPNPILTKSSQEGTDVIVTDPQAGESTITIRSEDTVSLLVGEYYHEVQLVDTNNQVSTVSAGYLTLVDRF